MKKILVVYAIFAAMVLMISCGSSSSSDSNLVSNFGKLGKECYPNKTCDAELRCDEESNTCVEDSENSVNDSDSSSENGDETDTTSGNDNDSEQNDSNDDPTTDPISDNDSDTVSEPNDNDADSGDSAPDSDGGDTANENTDNLPECSPTSAVPCFDSATSLIWSGQSAEKMHWADAVNYCKNLNDGGYSDWRLPSKEVLGTLVQNCNNSRGCEGDTDGKYSKFGDIVFLWSSTGGTSTALGIYFFNGEAQSKSVDESFNARCVRREGSETRQANCVGPEHSEWNTVSEITQTWDWNKETWDKEQMWIPSSNGKYDKESSTTECRFKCEENYFWDSSTKKCVNPCDPNPCDSLEAFTDKTCIAYSLSAYSCGGKDPASSLTWSAKAQKTMNWDDAVSYCGDLTEGGYSDWHLPNIDELKTLLIAKTE